MPRNTQLWTLDSHDALDPDPSDLLGDVGGAVRDLVLPLPLLARQVLLPEQFITCNKKYFRV